MAENGWALLHKRKKWSVIINSLGLINDLYDDLLPKGEGGVFGKLICKQL